MNLVSMEYPSPIGPLVLVAGEDALRVLAFPERGEAHRARLARRLPGAAIRPGRAPRALLDALDAYFAGELNALDGVAVETGGTPFQQKVWRALRSIAPGATQSYAWLARVAGAAAAVRAVGAANGANPVSVVLPCHRVVGSDGSLTGYGGGLERKRWLLAHEQRFCAGRRAG